ncbi:MAG: hypothetical protein ACKVX7_14835 [Planctomycetota bacterium]
MGSNECSAVRRLRHGLFSSFAFFGAWVSVATLALFVTTTSCTKPVAPPSNTEPEQPVMSAEEKAEEARQKAKADREARIAKNLESIKAAILKDPTQHALHIQQLEIQRGGARDTRFAAEIEKLIADRKADREKMGEAELAALVPLVDAEIAKGDYPEATELLESGFQIQYYEECQVAALYQAKLDEIRLVGQADALSKNILSLARHFADGQEYAQAIGVLVSFPDRFEKTKFAKEIAGEIDKLMDPYKQQQEERRAARRDDVAYVDVDLAAIATTDYEEDGYEVWTLADDSSVLTGENKPDATKPAVVVIGEDNWLNFEIEFEINVVGKPARFGFVARNGVRALTRDLPPDWIKLRATMIDGELSFLDLTSKQPIGEAEKWRERGGLAILLEPGTKAQIRGVRTRLLKEKPAEAADGGDKEKKPDEKES